MRTIVLTSTVVIAGLAWSLFNQGSAPDGPKPAASQLSPIFTPAHGSVGQAFRHFFGIEPEPVQPIPYPHDIHIEKVKLTCKDCHASAAEGPVAGFPSVTACMSCHLFFATEKPSIQALAAYNERGEEPPWQRVYGWPDEAHVRFNHAPHIRAQVECTTCHGDVDQMSVAERVVEHSMGFCIQCHQETAASNECMTCHY